MRHRKLQRLNADCRHEVDGLSSEGHVVDFGGARPEIVIDRRNFNSVGGKVKFVFQAFPEWANDQYDAP